MIHSIDIIAVVAAWVPMSVLSTSYWFCCGCWAVPLSYVTSCGACCSCWLIWALFFGCSLELISPHQYCHLQTSLTRNKKSCEVVFCYSGCFVSIWSTFFCLIWCLDSLQCLYQVVPTLGSTQQSQDFQRNCRIGAKVFPSLQFRCLIVVVSIGKITG